MDGHYLYMANTFTSAILLLEAGSCTVTMVTSALAGLLVVDISLSLSTGVVAVTAAIVAVDKVASVVMVPLSFFPFTEAACA